MLHLSVEEPHQFLMSTLNSMAGLSESNREIALPRSNMPLRQHSIVDITNKKAREMELHKNHSHYEHYEITRYYTILACRREQNAYFQFLMYILIFLQKSMSLLQTYWMMPMFLISTLLMTFLEFHLIRKDNVSQKWSVPLIWWVYLENSIGSPGRASNLISLDDME